MLRRIEIAQDSEGYIVAGFIRGQRHFWTDEFGWAVGEADHFEKRLDAMGKAWSLVLLGLGYLP